MSLLSTKLLNPKHYLQEEGKSANKAHLIINDLIS